MKMKILILVIFTILQSSALFAQSGIDTVWMKYTHKISRLEFSNDDSKILTVGSGGIIIFDTESGEQVNHIPGYGDAEYSKDNSMIVAVREEADSINQVYPYVDIIDAENYMVIKTIRLNKLPFNPGNEKVKISSDNRIIAVTSDFGLYFIDVEEGKIDRFLTQYGDEKRQVRIMDHCFTNDGGSLILSLIGLPPNDFGEIMFLNTKTYTMEYKYLAKSKLLEISDDGSMLAFQSNDKQDIAVTIMNTYSHEIINTIPGNSSEICGFKFSHDSKYIILSSPTSWPDFKTEIYNVSDLSLMNSLVYFQCFPSLDFSKGNDVLVGGGGQRIVAFNISLTDVINSEENIEILYPNPTTGSVNLIFELNLPTILNFNLYSNTGELIKNLKQSSYEVGKVEENILLEDISSGFYLLKIESLQFNRTYKIIINR